MPFTMDLTTFLLTTMVKAGKFGPLITKLHSSPSSSSLSSPSSYSLESETLPFCSSSYSPVSPVSCYLKTSSSSSTPSSSSSPSSNTPVTTSTTVSTGLTQGIEFTSNDDNSSVYSLITSLFNNFITPSNHHQHQQHQQPTTVHPYSFIIILIYLIPFSLYISLVYVFLPLLPALRFALFYLLFYPILLTVTLFSIFTIFVN